MLLKDQRDIFNIFHDGIFVRFELSGNDIDFTVDIQYLAELVNAQYRRFNGIFKACRRFELETWGEKQVLNDINLLNDMELEIASAEVDGDSLIIKCYCDGGSYGGKLIVVTQDILVFDQANKIITLDKLDEICRIYWDK